MIVVIGSPTARYADGVPVAAGPASGIALAAARAGRAVQLVGKTGDDPVADAVVLDLARGGVGHVALLRDSSRATPIEAGPPDDADPATDDPDASRTTDEAAVVDAPVLEAADVDLGLRYLTDYGVVVLADPAAGDVVAVASDAARWGEARLIVVVAAGRAAPDGLPADVVVLEAPDVDPDGVFAELVGAFAAALDEGAQPETAFRASLASDGWSGTEAG